MSQDFFGSWIIITGPLGIKRPRKKFLSLLVLAIMRRVFSFFFSMPHFQARLNSVKANFSHPLFLVGVNKRKRERGERERERERERVSLKEAS